MDLFEKAWGFPLPTPSDNRPVKLDNGLVRDSKCKSCKLCSTAKYVCLLGNGPTDAEIMIIGEAPGQREDDSGTPFVGRSGQLLRRLLSEHEIDPDRVFITNAVSCRPPDNRKPSKAEIKACKAWLDYQIEMVNPRYVLLLGNTPIQSLLEKSGIRKLRGKPIEKDGIIFFPTYHPAFALYDPKNVSVLERDIRAFADIIHFGGIPEERELDYTIVDTWDRVDAMLDDLRGAVAIDTETNGLYPWAEGAQLVSIGLGTANKQWVIPAEQAEVWSHEHLIEIIDQVTEALEGCYIIGHNWKFDALWMRVRLGVCWTADFDTMLAHYLVDENDLHGLKYLAQKLLGASDWDIGGEEKKSWSPKNAKYLAHDLYYTRKLRYYLGKKLKADPEINRVFEKIMMPCVTMFTEAEYNGVYINVEGVDEAEVFLRDKKATAQKKLDKWGKINWRSPKQVCKLLFEDLEIEVIERTKKGAPSVSESVIKRIDHPIAGDLLLFREADKQLSAFIEGWRPYLVNGRLHPSIKLHGTVTGRLSCEHPNLQQVPRDKRIRSLITAPPGWTMVECDLSQIELRIAAELANELNMLEMFRSGRDVHWTTALSELERGGGGDHTEMMYGTVDMYLMRTGLPPNGASAEILLNLWQAQGKGPGTPTLLQLESEEWADNKSRGGEWRKSEKRVKPLLERWRPDLGEEASKKVLRAMQEYIEFVSSPQRRGSNQQSKIQFGDVVSILSCIGPSVAQEFHEEWAELRKKGKAVGFGYLFGMWWKKFKMYARDNYGVTVTDKQAKESRENFFELYNYEPWHKRQRNFAKSEGYVRSLSGRKRRLPDAMDYRDTPERGEALRQAINSPVQSFANEINLMSALQITSEYPRSVCRLVCTIHDAILLEVRDDYVERVTRRLLEIMTRPALFDEFDIELSVPIMGEAKIGPWGSGVSLDKWLAARKAA